MSGQEGGRSPPRQRGSSSPPIASTPTFAGQAGDAATAGGPSGRKEPSLGVHAPGSNANPRRARSIHINIKSDPEPASGLGLPLPSWLAGSASTSKSSTTSPVLGHVPHRDFGMAPGRRASESHGHARALSAINARNSSISIGNSAGFPGTSNAPSRSDRWAATVRNQLRHIERDGLRRTFWNRRAFGNDRAVGGQNYVSQIWDKIRRVPELLLVEYEDPVDESSPWYEGGGEGQHDSSDTSDLLDEDGKPSTSTQRADRKVTRKKQSALGRLRRRLDQMRRAIGVSRPALVLLLMLLMLGIYESTKFGSTFSHRSSHLKPLSLRINTKDPFETLLQAGIDVNRPAIPFAEPSKMVNGNPKDPVVADLPPSSQTKVTAIVLNWKRTDNLAVILAHLCAFTSTIFSSVHVWNNNPDTFLTHETFAASRCPKGKLRIHNSPGNLLFMARYMACALADTPYCYFQDDDWLVPTLPAAHSHFMRNPDGPPVVITGDDFPEKEGWEWCFFNTDFDMNACFAWLGTGAFVSRARVLQTVESATLVASSLEAGLSRVLGPLAADEFAMLDNGFSTFQNAPAYVLASELVPMPQPVAFTASEGAAGDRRNELYIQKGLDRLSNSLGVLPNLSPYPPPVAPWPVDTSHTSQTLYPYRVEAASHRPHTYWHHSRAIAQEHDRIFMTNVANLPPPDAVVYQPHASRNLSQWEYALGESPDLWKEGKEWALAWGYYDAVDGDYRSAFRSPDIIRKGDYVGLDLLTQIPVESRRAINVHVVLEYANTVLPELRVEVSMDGYNWRELSPKPQFSCHITGHLSTQPTPSFPKTFLTSSPAQQIIQSELTGRSKSSWRGKARTRLESCEVALSTSAGGSRRKGWRFVRLRSERDMKFGWGVYEMWVS